MGKKSKTCIVPACLSSESDGKVMVAVPGNPDIRKAWLEAVMNPRRYSDNSRLYCCEDHFNLQTDAENFMFFKEAGKTIKIKDGVLPHICLNSPWKRRPTQISESAKKRKRRLEMSLEETRSGAASTVGEPAIVEVERPLNVPEPNTDSALMEICETEVNKTVGNRRKQHIICLSDPDGEIVTSTAAPVQQWVDSIDMTNRFTPSPEMRVPGIQSPKDVVLVGRSDDHPQPQPLDTSVSHTNEEKASDSSSPLAVPLHRTPQCGNPALTRVKSFDRHPSFGSVTTVTSTASSHSLYHGHSGTDSSSSTTTRKALEEAEIAAFKKMSWERESKLLAMESRMYLGLPKAHYNLIAVIENRGHIPAKSTMIVLKKIRTNDSHKRLGFDFGCTESNISQVFGLNIVKLSSLLSHLIFWPSKHNIILNMPLQFRYRFFNVEAIIDGFEIEIEKPSSPKEQSLTWSEYKKCNSIKYLISCTPQGFINFISRGYGGRVSDCKLVSECGFLNVLPQNCEVLADRGFKQVERLFATKNCKLTRPPSVGADEILSPELIKWSKQISGVRIHVERVISRVREFKFLGIHAAVDNKLVPLLDHAVVIACALINMQDPIIS